MDVSSDFDNLINEMKTDSLQDVHELPEFTYDDYLNINKLFPMHNNEVLLFKGSLTIIDKPKLIVYDKYESECATGFYTTENLDIAIRYANAKTKLSSTSKPIVNVYSINYDECSNIIRAAYYKDLNSESLVYLGENSRGLFPNNCIHKNEYKSPKYICHKCENLECPRSANYIEAILMDCKNYILNDIVYELLDNKISDVEAILKINKILKETNSKLNYQTVLRDDILNNGLSFRGCFIPSKELITKIGE